MLWSLPKGHIELGETAEQTAIREVAEETGIRGDVWRLSPWFTAPSTSRRSSGLLCEKRSTVAMDKRMPSHRHEWMFLSAKMTSPFWANEATDDMHER